MSCCQDYSPPPRNESFTPDTDHHLLHTDSSQHNEDLIHRFYEQASFWVLFMVLVLIMAVVVRSIYYSVKPNRVLELLRRMSTGPLSETKEGKEGNIEPVLFYYEASQVKGGTLAENKDSFKYKTSQAKRWFQHKMKDNVVYEIQDEKKSVGGPGDLTDQILDARKLLARQLERLEKSCYDTNTLNQPTPRDTADHRDRDRRVELLSEGCEDDCQGDSRTNKASRRPSGTYSLSIEIPGPLAPSYKPNMLVNNVWNTDVNMQRLYRYTTMQGMIYPPGYVP